MARVYLCRKASVQHSLMCCVPLQMPIMCGMLLTRGSKQARGQDLAPFLPTWFLRFLCWSFLDVPLNIYMFCFFPQAFPMLNQT